MGFIFSEGGGLYGHMYGGAVPPAHMSLAGGSAAAAAAAGAAAAAAAVATGDPRHLPMPQHGLHHINIGGTSQLPLDLSLPPTLTPELPPPPRLTYIPQVYKDY